MVLAIVPIAMVIVGVLINALASNATAKDFGRGLFYAGLFAFAFANAGKVVSF